MAFAQLTYRESLRDIKACLRAQEGKLYHMGIKSRVSRSTLADANEVRDWRIYADFAQSLLWAHATQDKYAWMHKWRGGDLVLWDNRCCMHYRSEVDPTQPRVLYRTVIKGEAIIPG